MNESVWEKNLQSLEQRYPQYANTLRMLSLKPEEQEFNEDNVRGWLHQAMSSPVEQVVLLGTRGGYAIQMLRKEYGLRNLVVIEKDYNRLAQVLLNVDLSDAIADPSVFWVVGYRPENLERGLEYCKTALAALGFQLLQHPPSWYEASDYYASILRELKRVIEHENFNLKARLARGTLVQRNLAVNLPHSLRSLNVDEASGMFTNVPAYIVAAGPSLDKNIEDLKPVGDSGLIFCVDTALRTLLAHEIHPHFVVTADPTQENASHFEGIELPEGCGFAFAPDAYYEIVNRLEYAFPRIALYDNSTRLSYYLKEKISLQTLLQRSQHVGESAIRLALALKCDPIILVGMDLALPPHAEYTHASHSSRTGKILSREGPEFQIETKDGISITPSLIEVPGRFGESVYTYYSFKMYLDRLDQLIRNSNVHWFDATEGGALKPGCEILPLHEVVKKFHQKEFHLQTRMNQLPRIGNDRADILYPYIRKVIGKLERTLHDLDKIARGAIEQKQAEAIWLDFLKDNELRAFLDHAVFQFQLYARPEGVPEDKRPEFLKSRAQEAAERIRTFIPLWHETLKNLNTSAL